jgi:AcrR family transcriptional regulator
MIGRVTGQEVPRRPHTGRRRNEAAREKILDVTFDLLRSGNAGGLTIDAIAEAAAVGRQTIYRWWPSKGAVVVEAMTRQASALVPARDTGFVASDLTAFLVDSFAALSDSSGTLQALRELASVAQHDEHVARALEGFTAQRRAVLRALLARGRDRGQLSPDADLDMLVETAYGVLWYRALISHEPLDAGTARRLAASILSAGR